jgi:RimJ/RimL family protein N-acetyltransferase
MAEILHKGKCLQIRKATMADLDFIMKLEYDPENLKFIVPFDRDVHTKIIEEGKASMDVIVEEIETKEPVGYLLINGLTTPAKELEWTHVIIAKKGMGYGHEAMKLLKAWGFDDLKFHRAWLDCKDYNARALHLYESEGMQREGLIRETILTNGVYENLVILGILDREYQARKAEGLEL